MSLLQNGLISKLTFTEEWQAYAMLIGFAIVSIIISYLLGSINSAIIISKLLYKEDIRTHGSGNAGMTNMLRTYGLRAAALTLVGDMLKTALAILFTGLLLGFHYGKGVSLGDGYCYMAGLFAVLKTQLAARSQEKRSNIPSVGNIHQHFFLSAKVFPRLA